ncbi:4'-phosphopantetheinyl transferase family protein [Streptomyces sp. NPDC003635]
MTAAYEYLRDHDAVHVWRGRAPDTLAPGDLDLLSEEELAQVRRLGDPAATRYASAHAALRRILSEYLGVPPREVVLGRRPCPRCAHPRHGRPTIDRPATDLDFNLSRSGPHWLLAVLVGRQVGVDLEDGRDLDVEGASRLVMSASELAHVDSRAGETERLHAFFRCWTRKEAVVKASGVGIITNLREVDVQPADDGPVLVDHALPTGPDTWLVEDLPVVDGVFAALARQAGTALGPVVPRRYESLESQGETTRGVLVP